MQMTSPGVVLPALALGLLLPFTTPLAHADTIYNITPSDDNVMVASQAPPSHWADRNWGAGPTVQAGYFNTAGVLGPVRSLLRFDVSGVSLPVGSQVTSIKLTFDVLTTSATNVNHTLSLYQIDSNNAAWVEGSKQPAAAATTGESTWNRLAAPSTSWNGGGGLGDVSNDAGNGFDSTALATLSGVNKNSGTITFTFAGTPASLTSLIQNWQANSGSDNAGILLVSDQESVTNQGNQRLLLYSKEGAAAENDMFLAPTLTITVPEPASLALLGIGGLLTLLRRKRE